MRISLYKAKTKDIFYLFLWSKITVPIYKLKWSLTLIKKRRRFRRLCESFLILI